MYRVAFTVGSASFLRGDVNGNGEVGIADVMMLASLWHMGLTKVMDKEMTIGGVYVGKGNFRNTGGVLTLGYKFKL